MTSSLGLTRAGRLSRIIATPLSILIELKAHSKKGPSHIADVRWVEREERDKGSAAVHI